MDDIREHREHSLYKVKQAIKSLKWIRDTLMDAIHAVAREGIGRKVGVQITIWTYLEKKEDKDG